MSVNLVQELAAEVKENRKSANEVSPLFLNRWSPRSFEDRSVSDADLNRVLEAAHWAASSYNDQPWRFIVAKSEEDLKTFREFLNPFNLAWAEKAPVLLLIASDTLRENGDPNRAHAFDAGAAWANLALQATILGLSTHAIGGFDREQAQKATNLPESYEAQAVIAIGYRGDKEALDERLQEREEPNTRKPLEDVVFYGKVEK